MFRFCYVTSFRAVYMEDTPAFDTIDHSKLLLKLDNTGICGMAHLILKSYWSNRKQYTSTLGEKFELLTVLFGVMYKTTFIFTIHNWHQLCIFCRWHKYFVKGKSLADPYDKTNKVLKCITTYMKHNKLHTNMTKCCYIQYLGVVVY